MEENDYYLAFSLVSGIGSKIFQNILKVFGSAENAWKSNDENKFGLAGIGKINFPKLQKFKKELNLSVYRQKLVKAKVVFVSYNDKQYPESLRRIDNPPIGIYCKGNLKLLRETKTIPSLTGDPESNNSKLDPGSKAGMTIAVVGARKITSYGLQVTSSLVAELCHAGFTIVSGMALGVDGVAHKTAIENKGFTIAVLGCGVDCPYPRENDKLYEEILDNNGLIISEYPLGMLANKGTFPARNRIIAGLSRSVLITEAAEDSGSLITASYAASQGKTVFAVPGQITSHMSRGSLKLLKQGAVMVSSASDIFDALQVKIQNSKVKSSSKNLKLSKIEEKILEILQSEERTIDEISKLTKIKFIKLSILLSEMELEGLLKNSGGKFSLKNV